MTDQQWRPTDVAPGETATEPLQADKTLSDLFGDLTGDLSRLFRQEVELAKVEARDELKRTGTAAASFAVAGLGGWMAVLFLSLALAWLLDQAMNTALAFAIVGLVWAAVAAALLSSGRKKMKTVEALPKTMSSLKEDVQWARTQKN